MAALAELPVNHDLHHLEKALQYCKSFRVAIDGGAHQGIWTKRLSEYFEQVFAFEPIKNNYDLIEESTRVIKFNRGLSNKKESRVMVPGSENTGQWHINPESDELGESFIPLDSLNLHEVDFIKLDVEGYELFALQGAKETILKNKPLVLIEENGLCSRYGVKKGDAGKFLKSLGYRHIRTFNKDQLYCL